MNKLTQEKVKWYLEDMKTANTEREKQLLQQLTAHPKKTLPFLVEIFQRYEKLLLGSAAKVIKEIGYPQNASTIPWLVGVCTDANLLGLDSVMEALRAMPASAVVPFFIAMLLKKDAPYWSDDVSALCWVLREQREWLEACAPAFIAVLVQIVDQPPEHFGLDPDFDPFLDIVELLLPECSYALPVLLMIAQREKEGEIAGSVRRLLAAFEKEALQPYHHLLADLGMSLQ